MTERDEAGWQGLTTRLICSVLKTYAIFFGEGGAGIRYCLRDNSFIAEHFVYISLFPEAPPWNKGFDSPLFHLSTVDTRCRIQK